MNATDQNDSQNLITWNGMRIDKAKMEEFCRNNNKISWYISYRCNFKCDYCGEWAYGQQAVKPIDLAKLSGGLDFLPKDWIFYISGGEPFLDKNFTEICHEITKRHYLSFSSNLTTPNIFEFADKINPDKCLFINASVHPTQREKTDKDFSLFIEKILYLQKKGFNIIVVYVAHPTLLGRIISDFERLRSHGIEKVHVKNFIGDFNGNSYPFSYSAAQKELLLSMESDYPGFELMNQTYNFHGQLCIAGQKSFAMDRNGNLMRCSSDKRVYGNLFEKSIRIDSSPKPCTQDNYACLHECIEFNLKTKGKKIAILKADFIEKKTKFSSRDYRRNKFWKLIGDIEKAGIPLGKIKKAFVKSK